MTSRVASVTGSPTQEDPTDGRSLGLAGATGVGVGAIVGGGILALAGVAFATTGPSTLLAFGLNGLIALLAALSFSEMATAFPANGGTYTFAKKVLSVEAAFMVGWVVWFASIVAAALYAIGFGSFGRILLLELWPELTSGRLSGHMIEMALALLATLAYAWALGRSAGGGGQWETLGKVVVFGLVILAGFWFLLQRPVERIEEQLTPFFSAGGLGLLEAMGYTFIALQGFDLIAAVGGEVRSPRRNLPRAIVGSLAIALVVYLPLLLIIATVGMSAGTDVVEAARQDPEALVAVAVENYLGRTGFWLIIVAAVLSMLSALQANLLASSRIALAMAEDRNLSPRLRRLHPERGTPVAAVVGSASLVVAVLVFLPDVTVAAAVASLIFLLSFTLTHWTAYLARRRGGGDPGALRLPFFPLVPILGILSCAGLALFQGVVVPLAGIVAAVWLALGTLFYFYSFAHRAAVADAAAEALDPQLMRLRGRSPIVLVPIANPKSAQSLVHLASSIAPTHAGQVLLLYVVEHPEGWQEGDLPPQLLYAQQVLSEALSASFSAHLKPQALTTIAEDPWTEIARVAQGHRCESLLLGLGPLEGERFSRRIGRLLRDAPSNLVILRSPRDWRLDQIRRVLVPVGGRRDQSSLRARLLGSLCRTFGVEVHYLGILPADTDEAAIARFEQDIRHIAEDEASHHARVEVVCCSDVTGTVVERSADAELVILGLRRPRGDEPMFGEIPLRVAGETGSALLMIHQRG